MATKNANTQGESWIERALDHIRPVPTDPKSPAPPPIDKTQWERSVDNHTVNMLTVYDVGLIVFNETQSFSEGDGANETIDSAREKLAHTIMNGDYEFGAKRPATALAVEPSAKAMKDPRTKAAYESSLSAAREAYLNPGDPTQGALYMKFLPSADRSNQKFNVHSSERVPLKTQSGPFKNSYLQGGVPSHQVYVNTYGQD